MGTWTGAVIELVVAFIGGGIFTTLVTEYFSRKRQYNALMLDRTANLVKAYQLYVRLLRRPHENWPEEALDNAHATFVAEVKILGFNSDLKKVSEELSKIARRMVNIRTDAKDEDKKRAALSKIYKDFDDQLQLILKHFQWGK